MRPVAEQRREREKGGNLGELGDSSQCFVLYTRLRKRIVSSINVDYTLMCSSSTSLASEERDSEREKEWQRGVVGKRAEPQCNLAALFALHFKWRRQVLCKVLICILERAQTTWRQQHCVPPFLLAPLG